MGIVVERQVLLGSEGYLLQLLSDLGFDLVLEQFDCDKDIVGQWTTTGWRKTNSRVLLAGIKSTAQT